MGRRLKDRIRDAGRKAAEKVRNLSTPTMKVKKMCDGEVDLNSGNVAIFIPPQMERSIESFEKLKEDMNRVIDEKIERLVEMGLSNGSTITSSQRDSIALFIFALKRIDEAYRLLLDAGCTDTKVLSRMGVIVTQTRRFFVDDPKRRPKGVISMIRNTINPEISRCLETVGRKLRPPNEVIEECRKDAVEKLRNRSLEVGFGVD